MLLKFIKKALQHRISNIELRRAQKEDEKKKREQIIGENDKIKKEKEEQYEKKKSSLPPEEVEAFENNEKEKWNATYDEEHPLKE